MRKLLIAAGILVCAWKGIRWALLGIPEAKKGFLPRTFGRWGFKDPDLDYVWEEQSTRPRGGVSHHLTDLIVEWNRLDAQRGAKLLSALAVLTFAIGVGVGWLL